MIYLQELLALGDYEKDGKAHRTFSGLTLRLASRTRPLWLEMGLAKPRIVFAKNLNSVAIYIAGSNPYPIILIDVWVHQKDMIQLEISVAHELIHCYLENIGLSTCDHDEDFVECLAREWIDIRHSKDIVSQCDLFVEKFPLHGMCI